MRIALELAQHNHVYEDIATKFFEHFLDIAEAMNSMRSDERLGLVGRGGRILLRRPAACPTANMCRCKVRSMVGLDPAVRGRDAGAGTAGATAGFRRAAGMVSEAPARPGQPGFALAGARRAASGGCCRCCAAIA